MPVTCSFIGGRLDLFWLALGLAHSKNKLGTIGLFGPPTIMKWKGKYEVQVTFNLVITENTKLAQCPCVYNPRDIWTW